MWRSPDARALVRAPHEAMRSHGTAEVRQRMTRFHSSQVHGNPLVQGRSPCVQFTIQESGAKINLLKVRNFPRETRHGGGGDSSRSVTCGLVTFHIGGRIGSAAATAERGAQQPFTNEGRSSRSQLPQMRRRGKYSLVDIACVAVHRISSHQMK
jgi:hypothetical protein